MDLPIQENRRRATCARCVHKAETVQIRHRELGTARARVPQHGRETVVCLARSLWRTALPPHSLRHTTASSDSRALTTAVFGAFRAACADGHTRGLLNGLQGAEAVSALQQRQQQPGVLDQPMTSGLAQAMTVALATMCDLLTTTSYDPARKIYVGVAFELKHNDAEYFCLGGTVSKAMASAGAPGNPGFINCGCSLWRRFRSPSGSSRTRPLRGARASRGSHSSWGGCRKWGRLRCPSSTGGSTATTGCGFTKRAARCQCCRLRRTSTCAPWPRMEAH